MATVIEAPPRTHVAANEGLWSWLTTVDHKRIGILYGTTAFTFFLIGGFEALLIRAQLIRPNNTFLGADEFNAMFTMHATTMIFLAIMPMSAAFFNFMVPLQIGARDVAFPRLNAFSYWVFLGGGLLVNISFLFNSPPDAGWFGYAPLTVKQYSPGLNQDFWVLGLQILGVASLAAAFNFLVTIVNMRCPGMTLMRMPLFTWMTFVTSFLLVLAFPVITVGLTELLLDRFFGTNFFNTVKGGDPVLWQHLFWVFGHPEVYILILPAMGIVSEVLPTFSEKPLFGYPVVVYSGIAIGFMSFGVWAHHMFAVGMGPIADAIFAVNTMLIAVPTGVKIFNWMGTMAGGRLHFTTAMHFAVGFIAMFTIGGLSGVMHASPPADLQQTDTYFIVAHFHYVLFGGSILGLFAGLYYWFPKITGRLMNEALGKLHFWTTFIGFNLTFMPMHWTGLLGMPRRVYTYGPELGVTGLNVMSTVGAYILGLSTLALVVNWIWSLKRGPVAGPDPWNGGTLEWTIPSPPPEYNFLVVPTVHSSTPFWDEKYGAHGEGASPVSASHGPIALSSGVIAGQEPDDFELAPPGTVPADHTSGSGAGHPAEHTDGGHGHGIHMPNPSYFPFVTALGMVSIFAGLMINPAISVGGLATMLWGIYGWAFEPAG
jgi:cytochrome c oxidase subunit I